VQSPTEQPVELAFQLLESGRSGRRLHMHHEIHRRQPSPFWPSAVDLLDSSLDSMSIDRSADLSADGDPESGRVSFVDTLGALGLDLLTFDLRTPCDVQNYERAVVPATVTVAIQKVRAPQ